MKKVYTFIALFLPLFMMGQSLEISPAHSNYYEANTNDWRTDYIHIKNVSGAPMPLRFQTLSNTFLSEWTSNMCAGPHCYNYVPSGGDLGTIENGEETFLACSMGFWEGVGEGTAVFRIFNPNDPMIADTVSITYHVNNPTGTRDFKNETNFRRISANPTAGELALQNEDAAPFELRLYDLVGRPVFQQQATGKIWQTSVRTLPSGMYRLVVFREGIPVFGDLIVVE
ncbi:MAG: T9SS C-terminal target domain-containing protein [Bacteroidetes bacterium]|nr:MAG: T9SS C-terminal target domain-containing protein [Bacteroidota bacterium]